MMIEEELKTLSSVKCPKCNSRMHNTVGVSGKLGRRYYCGHCKKRYKLCLKVIETELVEDK